MADVIPTSANDFIEQQLDERIKALEEAFDADALTLMGGLVFGVDDLIRPVVEGLRQRPASRSRLAVILTTEGGYIEVVQRIVDTFRHHYEHVTFIIPNYAFSAGTVLAMSGDDIFMDYYSRLGPIDPQVPDANGRLVPALGYIKQWEQLIDKANEGSLNTAEYYLLTNGFDQAALYQYEQARQLSITLLKEWLVKYKFKDWRVTATHQVPVTLTMKEERAEKIAKELNDTGRWHSHGHGISMALLRDDPKLNVQIDDLGSDPARHQIVRQYYSLLDDYTAKRGYTSVLHAIGNVSFFGTN